MLDIDQHPKPQLSPEPLKERAATVYTLNLVQQPHLCTCGVTNFQS